MIPSIFNPHFNYDLIRLGNKNDGGYLVEKNSIINTKYLVSFGINDDVSFESDFLKFLENKIKCHAFDNAVDSNFWVKKIMIETARFLIFKTTFKNVINLIKKKNSFYNFFKKNFFTKATISNLEGKDNLNLKNCFEYSKLMNSEDIFLKIDIEGSEYRILSEIIKFQNKFTGIIIEFHDFDERLDDIKIFVKQLKLQIVHFHINNFGSVNEREIPSVVEITFAKNPTKINDQILKLPHKLDMPNSKQLKDLIPKFEI